MTTISGQPAHSRKPSPVFGACARAGAHAKTSTRPKAARMLHSPHRRGTDPALPGQSLTSSWCRRAASGLNPHRSRIHTAIAAVRVSASRSGFAAGATLAAGARANGDDAQPNTPVATAKSTSNLVICSCDRASQGHLAGRGFRTSRLIRRPAAAGTRPRAWPTAPRRPAGSAPSCRGSPRMGRRACASAPSDARADRQRQQHTHHQCTYAERRVR